MTGSMSAALFSFDLVGLLFVAGVVVLVVSTLGMVLEMLHRRRSPNVGSPYLPGGRRGRTSPGPTPYAGVMLSPDAAKVLSVAQQRAGAKQASVELGLVGLAPSPVALNPAPLALGPAPTPLLDVSPHLEAIGNSGQASFAVVGAEPSAQGIADAAVAAAAVADAGARSAASTRIVRHLAPGEPVTTEMVLDVLQELAQRDPERLVAIIQEWLRTDMRGRSSEERL